MQTEIEIKPKNSLDKKTLKLTIRKDTTDEKVIKEVLTTAVYQKPTINFYPCEEEVWLDLGANIGTFALWALSRNVRHVYCYEPEPENYELLIRNLNNNYHSSTCRWDAVPHGVAVESGDINLYLCKGEYNKYRHTIFAKRGRKSIIISVDSFLEIMDHIKPTGVKIDIEGAEISILESVKPDDWTRWQTQKLVFEYSFDIDPSIPRFLKIIQTLKQYFTVVNYSKVKPEELEYKYFPAMTMVYCKM